MTKKPPRGRPPHELAHRFQIRCTEADHARWTLVARSRGLTLSQWARMVLLAGEKE